METCFRDRHRTQVAALIDSAIASENSTVRIDVNEEQGVVIPRVNTDDIVLREPVVETVVARKF